MTDRGSDSPGDGSDRTDNRRDDARSDGPAGSETTPAASRDRGLGTDEPNRSNAGSRDSRSTSPPAPEVPRTDARSSVTVEDDGVLRWFLESDAGAVVFVRDIVSSVGLVLLIALVLFGVSGVWPPLVAVESGSMEPNMQRGDMIFVVDEDRFVGDGAIDGTGVVTHETGIESGYDTFGNPGDVIIFRPGGSETATPVIHRAHFWVEEGENWVEDADPGLTNDQTCAELRTCPARHDGFITHGDANRGYDQANQGADTVVVKPEWVEGKAAYRIPWLGYIRLTVDDMLGGEPDPVRLAPFVALFGGVVLERRRP